MRLLLDTHVVLWYVSGNTKLSVAARRQIESAEVACYSAVSLWEVAIKHSISAAVMPTSDEDFAAYADSARLEYLPLSKHHISMLKTLRLAPDAKEHRDPFDRMLICQAKAEGMRLLTHDALLAGYGEPCVFLV